MDDKKKKDPQNEISVVDNLGGWFRSLVGEFKKIIWPDRKTLVKHTINVILVSALIGGVIVLMDLVFSQGYTQFIYLFQ